MNINSMVVLSDLHAGCQMGLCPVEGAALDCGGGYVPSGFQVKLWAMWEEFWGWVDEATEGDKYALVVDGDAMDGRHHGSTTQWTQNLADQHKVAEEILRPRVEQKKCVAYYHVRGTEAHVGPAGEQEEALAKDLGAIPNALGNCARYELWKWLGRESQVLVHIMHHIGTTGSQHYESTAVHKELIEAYTEAGRWGRRPPDFVVRAHRHRFMRTEVPTRNQRGVSVVLPGWQGKTPFVWRLAGGRQSQPQFGGIVIRVSKSGEPYMRHWVHSLAPPEPE